MRAVFAENVQNLMDSHFKDNPNRPMKLSKESGVSLSTVQRILAQKVGASLDNIESIAEVFDLSVYQIMLAGLDIKNPQVVTGAVKNEKVMYRRWQQSRIAVPQ